MNDTCPVTGIKTIEISVPIKVKPFAKIGKITTKCCGMEVFVMNHNLSTLPEKIAVIYARYSSHNQREESIDAQIRACIEYAERLGYTVIEVYADSALSATTDKPAMPVAIVR